MKQARKGEIIILLAILLLFVLLRFPTLYEPFGRDQGIFATIASGLLDWNIPYRDLWDHKPPGIYFLYALAFRIFGIKMRSISLFDGFYTLCTLLLLFTLTKELFDRRTAYLAILLFTMLSSGIFFLGWWGRGQPEVFMLLPLVGMIYFLRPVESREKEVFPVLLAGITGGIAFSLKSTIAPLLLLICLTLGLEGWLDSKQIRKGIVRILLFSLGVIIILAPFFIFFLVNGALEDLLFANVTFNLATHMNHPLTIGFVRNLISLTKYISSGRGFLCFG